MLGLGALEILIVLPMALIGLAVPIVTLVGIFLIYNKLKLIEELLRQRD